MDLPEGKDQIDFVDGGYRAMVGENLKTAEEFLSLQSFVIWDSFKCECLADSSELCDYCKKVLEEIE